MRNRQTELKRKDLQMTFMNDTDESVYSQPYNPDFSKIKVGLKTLDDAVVTLGDLKKVNPRLADKKEVLRAINNGDYDTMRDISNFFFKTSGIYSRLCRYMAYLYRYDWMVTPYVNDTKGQKSVEKTLDGFHKVLSYLDNFNAKKFFGEVALKVIRNGCYYGYLIPLADRAVVQELPVKYCRSRYAVNGRPAIEFNMKFFDDSYRDTEQRMRILKLFPKEFRKGYILYKEGKLKADFQGDTAGWYLLDPQYSIKFNINEEDFPAFISVIPAIIDLDSAQDLDRKKMQQHLLKIIIQKMPLDKNGDLIFDVDEAQQLHNNAVRMLAKAIGVDVLTTFADTEVATLSDTATATSIDELTKVERAIYNEAGVSQMQFNTDGNIALEKSILNDEASMYNLLLQFQDFLNRMITPYNKNPKKLLYKVDMLTTTIYNYKEMSKLYKEQVALGYSKMLPQIALGHSQSSILATAYFENQILDLASVFVPPTSSNNVSAEAQKKQGGNANNKENPGEEKKAGRKELENDQKSEKTIANRESMN